MKGEENNIIDIEGDSNDPVFLKKMLNRKARLYISSGSDEPVLDTVDGTHSLFAKKFIDVLENKNEIYADMVVWYKYFMPQTFGSHVTFDKKKLSISTTYIEGPLKDLKTNWIFESLKKNQTRIHFNVEFEFKRFFHQKIAEAFFPLIENKMIESFKVRADEILD